jgi:integrase
MGFSRKRIGRNGRPRYTAYYLDAQERARSAGTFSSRKDADRAWQAVEAAFAAGRPTDPRRGRITFQHYVDKVWFPNHVLEPSTRQSYHYVITKHLMPTFGKMRMGDILPAHVREWVTERVAAGMTPANIRHSKIVLSAIFTTALNDLVIGLHPCKGVKSPTVAVKEYRILTPEEFDRLYDVLPSDAGQLLIETLIDSGLRWGELAELRVRDIHRPSGIVTVSRSVVEVDPKFHPSGERFAVKPYPKGRRSRRFKVTATLLASIWRHVDRHRLGADDLLFTYGQFATPTSHRPPLVDVTTLGLTEPDARDRSYRHGTRGAYTAGKCRCVHCRRAFAEYRAERRAAGLDQPRAPRVRETDGHVPAQWFRNEIWRPACRDAGIDPPVRLHDLRHSHASWLLAGGADLQVVKERLGHRSIATTEKYLHTLPDADETALAALDRVRKRSKPRAV